MPRVNEVVQIAIEDGLGVADFVVGAQILDARCGALLGAIAALGRVC